MVQKAKGNDLSVLYSERNIARNSVNAVKLWSCKLFEQKWNLRHLFIVFSEKNLFRRNLRFKINLFRKKRNSLFWCDLKFYTKTANAHVNPQTTTTKDLWWFIYHLTHSKITKIKLTCCRTERRSFAAESSLYSRPLIDMITNCKFTSTRLDKWTKRILRFEDTSFGLKTSQTETKK